MSHFAKVIDGVVVDIIAIDQDMINTGQWGPPEQWVQTSFNTHGGVYTDPLTGVMSKEKALRKNYAGVGYTYDAQRDAFIPPKPYESWVLNEDTCQWEAPVKYPDGRKYYYWDEENINWAEDVPSNERV